MADYTKPDFWTRKAKSEGYPARSVYKLKEIDAKFGLFRRGRPAVLDLGAAPGSWSLYALRTAAAGATLTAVDLAPLAPSPLLRGPNVLVIQGDITDPAVQAAALGRGPFHVVMSDAAPATTGSPARDSLRSLALAEAALGYAQAGLAPGGRFVVKLFQGSESAAFQRTLRDAFPVVRAFKPQASRHESVELFCICTRA